MDNLVEFRKFLTENNPYAINIVINVFDNEVEKNKTYETYCNECKKIKDKFLAIELVYKQAMVNEAINPSREQEIFETIRRVEEEL